MRDVLTDIQSDLAGFPTEAFERQTISDLAASMKSDMARVVVIGTSCAGKTTFARALARLLSFPHIELDALHWLPNWTERSADEFCAFIAQALSQDCWVIDGNYAADLTWSRATTVIWLNYSFSIVLWRALTRPATRADEGRNLPGQP